MMLGPIFYHVHTLLAFEAFDFLQVLLGRCRRGAAISPILVALATNKSMRPFTKQDCATTRLLAATLAAGPLLPRALLATAVGDVHTCWGAASLCCGSKPCHRPHCFRLTKKRKEMHARSLCTVNQSPPLGQATHPTCLWHRRPKFHNLSQRQSQSLIQHQISLPSFQTRFPNTSCQRKNKAHVYTKLNALRDSPCKFVKEHAKQR